ncbi:MAG: hypothetical protein CUN56_06015 [Phototrophicales bacterium]|nr:MAG: hypothetical protein CUN56_06015 [Phototrophicales bacterium]
MSDNFKPTIWRLQAHFNTQGLVEALQHPDAGIRKRAAAALRALGVHQAIPALEAALDIEDDPEARSNMVSALATLKQEQERHQTLPSQDLPLIKHEPTEAEKLIDQLKASRDVDEIITIIQKLGALGDKIAVEPLIILFNNATSPIKIRLEAAQALLQLESAPIEVALLGALQSPEWQARRNAAAILGQLKATWAIEPLSRALSDPNNQVRRMAYAALKFIGTKEATQALNAVKKRRTQQMNKPAPTNKPQYAPNDETQKIEWPKRMRQSLAPTKPLDPDVVDKHERQQRDQDQNKDE